MLNKEFKFLLKEDGKPVIAGPILAIAVVLLVISFYAALVPFSFVFKSDGEVVYTQEDVKLFSNFENNAADSEGSEVVYGKDAAKFVFYSNKKNLEFKSSYFKLRMKMYYMAAKNLVTLKWDEENFVIEMNEKPAR